MASLDVIFKAYDIRGTVPEQLDAETCRRVGAAFARFSEAPRIVIGRDMRESGIELSQAFAEGATSVGANVVDLGLASTDLLYFASGQLDAPGAMLTASHNPARYNGIKLCLPGAQPVGQDTGLDRIRSTAQGYLADGLPEPVAEGARPGRVTHRDLLADYAGYLRGLVDLSGSWPRRRARRSSTT